MASSSARCSRAAGAAAIGSLDGAQAVVSTVTNVPTVAQAVIDIRHLQLELPSIHRSSRAGSTVSRELRPRPRCTRSTFARGGPHLEDQQLVARARAGDGSAFSELVRQHQQLAFHTAYLILGDAAEAEDAAQEAFLKAFTALNRFRLDAPFRPWLLEIVANQARNHRRAAGRRAHLALRASGLVRSEPGGQSPELAALERERRGRLLQAVDGLREAERLAIAGRYFLDLSEVELAAVLGCPRGTVKSRLSRALARLRAGLLEQPDVEVARG